LSVTSHKVQPPACRSQELSDLCGLELDGPPQASLVFEHLWPPLTRSTLLSNCLENHLIWVDSIQTVPLAFC
jgi:hypothetical protein